uniref:HEAT repeat-containing protein 6 n=1 Tax=Scophthalmus maximus TaxID=52904 RepID=A0A8D3CWF0_SCOMX
MATHAGLSAPALGRGGVPAAPPVASAQANLFSPRGADGWQHGSQSDAEKQFSRCAAKLRALRADSRQLREELNQLFDQRFLITLSIFVFPFQDVCTLLKHASGLVPLSQEHLVIKLCQLMHHLLNQLKVIMDEQTLDVLVNYTASALKLCSTWTHSDVLLALSTIVYGNGSQCHQHLSDLLVEDGVLLQYSAPSQPNMELRRVALICMANICLRIPGQPLLDDKYKSVCFGVFLKTLQSPRPLDTDELFYCLVIQAALKGLQCCLSSGKWKFGGGEELGSVLATLKRLMFQAVPGVNVEWPSVLYPAPLPQYEGHSAPKPAEPQKPSGPPKDKKSRGKGKKTGTEQSRGDDGEEDDRVAVSASQKGGGGEFMSKTAAPSLYPSWKVNSSDSEFSDAEGNAQSKLRIYHGRVRQGALHCLQAVVKGVEKRTLYGYWSSFIPEAPIGGRPSLTLLTIICKDPSPKVRECALQVLSAMLDGSRQFLAVAEDTASPRTSYTPLSFSLATAVRELHRALSLALLAETAPQTLTQIIKCLAFLVANAPYHRLRPGLLSPLWKQIRSYVRYRDANVRVSVLTLYGALVTTQAPLPEVQLLLQQPDSGGGSSSGSYTPQDSALSWRQRCGESSPSHTPGTPSKRSSHTHSPNALRTLTGEDSAPPWLLQLCVSLVTQPREEQSDSEGGGMGAGAVLEPSPVRVEALQDKMQLMCITVLLGLTYSEKHLVKTAAVRALGVYILFPCLRKDVMFVADTANTVLTALSDRSPIVRAKAAWSLGNLTDTLIVIIVGVDIQEELSDMLLLKMLQAATRGTTDNDRVKANAVRALGNLLHFLRQSQLTKSTFQPPLQDAVHALVQTVQSEGTMKVRWNACYALGNAFKNPALPLDSAVWSCDAFSALCHVVTSCKNFKVRIKSAAALAVPTRRGCYGDTERFGCVWHSLATALENSEDTNDFLEYRYSASLRHTLSHALLHLLSISQSEDMPALGASLESEEGKAIKEHLLRYLRAEEGGGEGAEGEKDTGGNSFNTEQRIGRLQLTLTRLRELKAEGEGGGGGEEESGKEVVLRFLEDLLKTCEEQ